MEIREFDIKVGAEKPFSAFHITDNHICLADERDNERKRELAENRALHFTDGKPRKQIEITSEMLNAVRAGGLPLIHTGDLIDFVSKANLDFAKEYFSGIDAIVSAGNHEFSQYVGEAWEDEAYKRQSLAEVEKAMPDGIEFGVRIINGIKFITLDDGYYYVLPDRLERLKSELADGISSVLVLHNPVYSPDTYKKVMFGKPLTEPPYLTGCPDELLSELSEHRRKQQHTDETTAEFVSLCNSCENIKAVISGHLHTEIISYLENGAIQIAADAAFHNVMYKYNFI